MKRIISVLVFIVALSCNAQNQRGIGNAFTIAFAKNVESNDIIKVEFIGRNLFVTNLTDATIYIDKRSTQITENTFAYNLSTDDTTIEAPIAIGPQTRMNIKEVLSYFGQRNFDVRKGSAYLKGDKTQIRPFDKFDKKLLNTVDKLYREMGKKQEITSSYTHMTEDESFLHFSAYIVYSDSQDMSNKSSISLSSWASDAVLSKGYLLTQKKEKTKGIAVDEDKEFGHRILLFADKPFETDEETSPVTSFTINLNKVDKGELVLSSIIELGMLANVGKTFAKALIPGYGIAVAAKNMKNTMNDMNSLLTAAGGRLLMDWLGNYDLTNKQQKKEYEKIENDLEKGKYQ